MLLPEPISALVAALSRLPGIGPAVNKNILARVFGLLALLLQSGVGLLEALAASAESAFMSPGSPYKWTTTIALVRGVIAAAAAAGSSA